MRLRVLILGEVFPDCTRKKIIWLKSGQKPWSFFSPVNFKLNHILNVIVRDRMKITQNYGYLYVSDNNIVARTSWKMKKNAHTYMWGWISEQYKQRRRFSLWRILFIVHACPTWLIALTKCNQKIDEWEVTGRLWQVPAWARWENLVFPLCMNSGMWEIRPWSSFDLMVMRETLNFSHLGHSHMTCDSLFPVLGNPWLSHLGTCQRCPVSGAVWLTHRRREKQATPSISL